MTALSVVAVPPLLAEVGRLPALWATASQFSMGFHEQPRDWCRGLKGSVDRI